MNSELNIEQIKKLWTLDLIISSGSLKKAALRAKVSPSAISQSLTALERTIGKRLIVRDRGSVTPTQEALTLLQTVRPAFEIFEKLHQTSPTPHIAWMNFGTSESLAIEVLPGLVHELRERLPSLRLNLRICRSQALMTMLRKGELCTVLTPEVDGLDEFCVRELASDRMGVYVSSRHRTTPVKWKDLAKIGLGAVTPESGGHPRFMTKYLRAIELGKLFLMSDSFESLLAAACAGTIAAILPTRVARRSSDLLEVEPPRALRESECGRHRIYLVSLTNCDVVETDFLADVVGRIMVRAH